MSQLPKLVVIVGPTASGKTALALALAREFGGEIVNADSRQVYRGMDVATAKTIDPDVPHHCFDLVDPDEPFSLSEYQRCAKAAIRATGAIGRVPILVGGTGLYVRAIVENLEMPDVPPDPELRAELEARSLTDLLAELDRRDPETARVIQRSNKRRVVRALEVVRKAGASFTELGKRGPQEFEALIIGLNPEKDVLRERVERRVDEQLAGGLMEETQGLLADYDPALPSMSGIGYPEVIAYLRDELTLSALRSTLVTHTLQYAKRQMTYFKKMPVAWVSGFDEVRDKVKTFLHETP